MTRRAIISEHDLEFAHFLHGESIGHWSPDWWKVGEPQRKGVLRVEVHNRWTATIWAMLPVVTNPQKTPVHL